MLPLRSRSSNVAGALLSGAIVVVFCGILLWHDPRVFWNDDYQLSVLPVFADMARSWSEGHWPILSPYSWVCGNLAGEFQYGVFSLFVNAVILLVWKFPLTFSQQAAAVSTAHLFVLAAGAFLLARDRQLSLSLSIFVALVAGLNGWIICWGATDWFGALGAFTWLPWAWWSAERAVKFAAAGLAEGRASAALVGGHARNFGVRIARFASAAVWPAPFVYLLVTGGFPYTVLMLLLLIAWLSVRSLMETRNVLSIVPLLVGVGLGFGLSAPAWLALLDLIQGSAREAQSAAAHWQWRVPPGALPGLVLPSWTVRWTEFSPGLAPHSATELACGLVAPAAVVAGVIAGGRSFVRQIKWDLVLLFCALLLSMLPTAGLFRWSFRWLPFFHLVLAICAAEALQSLSDSQRGTASAAAAVILVALTAIAMAIFGTQGPYAFPLVWIYTALALLWLFLEFFLRDRARSSIRSSIPAGITFFALLATYLCIPTNCGVPTYNFSRELLSPGPLDPTRLYLGIYPWTELTYCTAYKPQPVGQILRPGNAPMWAGLRFINGYSPIRAAGVAREFATSTHGEINPGAGSYLLNSEAGGDGELALLGVDGIVVAREAELAPQPASEWELVVSTDEGQVFHRRGPPIGRVRSLTSIRSRPDASFAPATITRINDSRTYVEADVSVPDGTRPALLAFSRPYFRGYQARLGAQKLAVMSYRGLFPMVELPPGSRGRLILTYRPSWLVWGGVSVAVCAAMLAVGLVLMMWFRAFLDLPIARSRV